MSEEFNGAGYGKAILFGEHFVVYGVPAIASGISLKTLAKVKPVSGKDYVLKDDREATPGYKEDKFDQQKDSLCRIFKEFDFNPRENPVEIELYGSLPGMSGIGASAASCVAIARALSKFLNRNLSDERINQIAFEGEKGYHGTPSGLDNTASTYGDLLWFQKGERNTIERIPIKERVEIVIGNSGLVCDTKAAVAGVRQRREEDPNRYSLIFEEAKQLMFDAREAIEEGDWEKVGGLMNKNQELLYDIEVSCPVLDEMVELARENGALGAKLTGGGLGGCMLALTPGQERQERVAKALEGKGYSVLRTAIGSLE
jgi:mevalonate kinase